MQTHLVYQVTLLALTHRGSESFSSPHFHKLGKVERKKSGGPEGSPLL